ncbi:SF3a splicing factor complex subunit [Massospora cicadina]|nr:SF3a splicing factor complex subunit [Massospora cicadina]
MVEMSLVGSDATPAVEEVLQNQPPTLIYPPQDTRTPAGGGRPAEVSSFGVLDPARSSLFSRVTSINRVETFGRQIIDRTAAFVARNDKAFEDKVRESKRDNPQFSFLNPGDPYYAYYRYEVSRNAAILLDPKLQACSRPSAPSGGRSFGANPASAQADPSAATPLSVQTGLATHLCPRSVSPAKMPFLLGPTLGSDLPAQFRDIIKLTALFVARNGPQFRAGLTQRESRNYQFDFLRPGHSLFPSFNRLVEQYSAVLLPSKLTLARLNEARQDKASQRTLERVMKRVEYSLYEESKRKEAAAKEDQERMAYAAIDWHDFVIVQTLEFTETDQTLELPPPLKLDDLAGLSLATRQVAPMGPTSEYNQPPGEAQRWDEEAAVKEETEVPPSEPGPTPTPVAPMKIRKDYIPKAMVPRTGAEPTQACPICGISLPVSEIDEHIRVESLDPKWKEQKAILEKRQRDSNLVGSSADVTKHLKTLSTYRSDLFGSDEVGIGKKIEEDAQRRKQAEKAKAVYDGFTQAPTKTVEDQIAALHRKVSSAPAPPPPLPPQPFNPPPPFPAYNFAPPPFVPPVPAPFFPPGPFGPPMDGKRFSLDDPLSQLLPEPQWIAMHPAPYGVQVQVPHDPSRPEWNLNGQVVWLEDLPASTTIQQIKDRLAEMLGFPASKQKITVQPANPNLGPQVAKNVYSLATYNVPPNSKIELAIKERGGKK